MEGDWGSAMDFSWKHVTKKINSENIRFVLKEIENKYPDSTMNGLFEGDRARNGSPLDQLSGHKNDDFVIAVKHCASWIVLHGAFHGLRQSFNEEYDALYLKHCVERWIPTTFRYRHQKIHIPTMAWIAAAKLFGLEESPRNYPYYKISTHAIRRGSYLCFHGQIEAVTGNCFPDCICPDNIAFG
ncbi:hypothetical protein ACLLKL_002017 [Escherichia coli]